MKTLFANKIDFHVHITPPEISANWQDLLEKEPTFEPHFTMLSKNPINVFATAEETVSMLDSAGFDMAVVFGLGFRDPGLCRMVNDYVIEKVRQFPTRLVGFMSVSPGAKDVGREIARCHDAGLIGVGEICPSAQNFTLDDKGEMRAFVGACKERNLPLILHANEPVGHSSPKKNATSLRQIESFIEDSQGLRVILSHLGGGLLFYETMPKLREKFRNVFYDTAAMPFLYDSSVYHAALALGLSEKIIFGSDFPLLHPSRYMPSLETLPANARDQILGGNAKRLLAS